MEKKDTKQRILDEALSLFAMNGYEGVTVADIAGAVGIKAPSLYKHYTSKQDIFDAILKEMAKRYQRQMAAMQINGVKADEDIAVFMNISNKQLVEMTRKFFRYFLHDEYARKFRHMLTIEQYKNPTASGLYVEQYIDSPIFYQSTLFKVFMEQDKMQKLDPKTTAMHFYAPIFLMLCLCDSSPKRENEALEFISQHVVQFYKIYVERERL